jgi:hypothetical protein
MQKNHHRPRFGTNRSVTIVGACLQAIFLPASSSAGPTEDRSRASSLLQLLGVRSKTALHAIRDQLLAMAKDDQQRQKSIQRDIAVLLESAKVLDRKSFFWAATGFIASTAVAMALAPDQTRSLYQLLKSGLKSVIHFLT